MMPTCVSPKVNPCMVCTAASTAIGGDCAVMTQRRMALEAPIITSTAGGQRKRGEDAERPQGGDGQAAKALLLPGDGGDDVVGRMAALDQRRGQDDGEKAWVAQQRARALMRGGTSLQRTERLQPEADQRAEPGHP